MKQLLFASIFCVMMTSIVAQAEVKDIICRSEKFDVHTNQKTYRLLKLKLNTSNPQDIEIAEFGKSPCKMKLNSCEEVLKSNSIKGLYYYAAAGEGKDPACSEYPWVQIYPALFKNAESSDWPELGSIEILKSVSSYNIGTHEILTSDTELIPCSRR